MPGRHEEYYFEDGSVVLLVEQTLFRVHRYYFTRESQIFSDMFSLPIGPNEGGSTTTTMEGKADSSPIEIPGVTEVEMESFLGFVYFGMHDENTFTLESWIALLSFSTRFICDKIRARSIREIESARASRRMDPIECIVLAVRHNVPQWLAGAYQELCQRQEPLSEEEGGRLGLSTVIKLMRAREILLSGSDMRDPRHQASRVGRTPGVSSTSRYLQLALDSEPVRPSLVSDLWGNMHAPGMMELRFDPQRVADVVREVFFVECSPSS